ncbi:MAG: hypothetical protein ACHQFX_15565 [Chitinophagales bacterium]
MKIGIFEMEHFEGAFPVIKLFDMPGNEITIYTSSETHKRFLQLFGNDAERYQWAVLSTRVKFRFFYTLYKELRKQKPDLLYINTVSNNHLLYSLVLRLLGLKRTVLTVHDINCLFESRPSWDFRKAIIHRGKKWLIRYIDEFNVVADTMIPYLQTKIKGKMSHNVSGAVFENRYSPQNIDHPLRIVVPGSLDKRRRNYEQVFELINLAEQSDLKLEITLLGGYSDDDGESIAARADSYHPRFCSVIAYHVRVVDQEEFDKKMDAAHFVFIPSVVETWICGDIPEIYGKTKSSGNVFDVIKHAKPFIVPERLNLSTNLQTSCFKYKEVSDIIDFLEKLISSPGHYEFLQENALRNSKNYTIEKVRERNAALFKS